MTLAERNQLIEDNLWRVPKFVKHFMPNVSWHVGTYEDALQAAYLGLVLAADTYDPARAQFQTHAWHTVHTQLRRLCRSSQKWQKRFCLLEMESRSQQAESDRLERYEDLYQALLRLPPRERDLLLAEYRDGLELKQVAKRFGITVGQARSGVERARRKLREMLAGVYVLPRRQAPDCQALLQERMAQGHSTRAIAEELKIPQHKIKKWCRELKLQAKSYVRPALADPQLHKPEQVMALFDQYCPQTVSLSERTAS